jgi:hypothetical protein
MWILFLRRMDQAGMSRELFRHRRRAGARQIDRRCTDHVGDRPEILRHQAGRVILARGEGAAADQHVHAAPHDRGGEISYRQFDVERRITPADFDRSRSHEALPNAGARMDPQHTTHFRAGGTDVGARFLQFGKNAHAAVVETRSSLRQHEMVGRAVQQLGRHCVLETRHMLADSRRGLAQLTPGCRKAAARDHPNEYRHVLEIFHRENL